MPTSRARKKTGRKARSRSRRLMQPEDLLQFTFVGDAQTSPDGSSVLFTHKTIGKRNDYVTNLWSVPIDGSMPRAYTNGGRDSNGRWSPDGKTIAFIRGNIERGLSQIMTIRVDGGEAKPLTDLPPGRIGAIQWSPDGNRIAFSYRRTNEAFTLDAENARKQSHASIPPRVIDDLWYRLDGDGYFGADRFALYVVDASGGSPRKIFSKDDRGDFSFDWAPDSKRVAVTADTRKNTLVKDSDDQVFIIDSSTRRAKKLAGLPRGPKTHIRWSPDGRALAWAGREGSDGVYSTENLHLFVHTLNTGRTRNLLADTDQCLLAITLSDAAEAAFGPAFTWRPDSKAIVVRVGWHGCGQIISIDVRTAKQVSMAKGNFEHALGTFDRRGRVLSLVRSTASALPEIAVARAGVGRTRIETVTSFNSKLLGEFQLAIPESQWIDSSDGSKIHLWVMKPPRAKKGQRLPAVLEIHGGPHAQYGESFFHEFQVLAAAGYVVCYSNPRGSKGYGRNHCAAIRGAWGTADWIDVQAVIEFMKTRSFINPKRMGVMGGSYGGYMTNWIIGQTREFAAAITDRCVSNLVSMWGSSDYPGTPDQYWEGNGWDRPEALWRSSPIRHLGNARTPTLIIHSEGDLRCNVEQSEQVFTVLRTHNVPARFVRYPRTSSHGMSRAGAPDLRLHRLDQILAWWNKYL